MKIKLLRNLSITLSLFLFSSGVKAQNGNNNYFQPNIFPSGPNSQAFQKFGNYPVNLYSGLADISIPLYTIEAGGLKVPIILCYHPSGIRIADVATWSGLGWSINTGGTITRNIMGLPDDNGYLQGDMQNVSSLLTNGLQQNQTGNNILDFFHSTITNRGWDNMPDIYSYQIPGYSGKFFFDGTNKYKIEKIPFSPINITGLTGPNGTGGFNITDDHGNRYILGHSFTETTGTPIGGGTPAMNGISAWMLEQIISQNKRDTINFSYTSDYLQYPDGLQENFSVEDSYQVVAGAGNPGYVNGTQPPTILNNPSTVTEQQLSTITYKNGRVNFILSQNGRNDVGNNEYPSETVKSLNTIQVSNYNYATKMYEVEKSIVFYQSYFNAGIPGAQRLRLDSIQILDKAGSIIQHYRFTYNTAINLPAYGSLARDFWGYYNGKTSPSITDLIPQTTIQYVQPNGTITNMTIGSNDPTSRNPDSNYMQANMLTRIDYPTGGYTTFNYQTNRYYDSNNNLQLAGGLRISSISSYPGPTSTSPTLVKSYQYNKARANFINNGTGTPLLNNGVFQNAQINRWWVAIDSISQAVEVFATKRVRRFFAQPNEDLAPDAIPVAYSNVTEYDGTPSANIGKTIYIFRDAPIDNWQTADMTGIPITYSFFYARGQLLEKKAYMNTGGVYQVVSDESHGYSAFPARYYNAVGLAIGQNNYNDGVLVGSVSHPYPVLNSYNDVASNTYPYSYYSIVSDDNYLTGTTNKVYDMADTTKFASSSVTYNYAGDTTHQQIVSTSHTDSKGNTRTTTNIYPYNYNKGNAVIDTMVSHNMFAEPIEKTETYTTASGTETTASQLNQYQFGSLANSIVPAKISTLSVAQPITNFTPSSVVSGNLTGDSRYVQMISFDQYDPQNNITHYTPRNATPTAIMWDYQYELPVAQVKNVPPVSNTSLYYAYTSFETKTSTGNWSYSGAPVYDVTAPTGFYSYRLSSGTINSGASLGTNNSYVLSYWSNNGSATVVYQGTTITGTALKTANGWSYYEHQLPSGGISSVVTISGSTSVDDLRLYPATAQMTTYAYDPSGLRSIADTKGSVNYFEYDFFQRLQNVKDWNGNIVKNYGYHTYDQTYGNQAQTGTFTRNNCPAGTSPQSASYTVPANKYYSSTLASANADAVYDLNTNGQINADNPAVCGCPVVNVTVTVHNSTSATFSAYFSGIGTPYSIPLGNSTLSVPPATYSTLTVNSNDSNTHTFTLGTRTPQSNVHNASFSNVVIATGSSDLTLTMQ